MVVKYYFLLITHTSANYYNKHVPFIFDTGHVNIMEILVKNGADINAMSNFGAPLHAAVKFGIVNA